MMSLLPVPSRFLTTSGRPTSGLIATEYSLTLSSHYFVWCEGTINVTFTLKMLLGCVYVQLLTYEDVTVYISLS